MVTGIMEQAKKLQDLIGLFPAAKEGTIIRRILFMIQKVDYKPEQNAALVDVYYGSPPGIDNEFFAFADYWADVMHVLQKAQRLGEKSKTVFGFEHALHTYYYLKMNEAEQKQYKKLYECIVTDLQTLMATILAEARALEESRKLEYTIILSIFPSSAVSKSPREMRNFQVLEDKLFLDPVHLKDLKKFIWSSAAGKSDPYVVKLTGIRYHLPHISFT